MTSTAAPAPAARGTLPEEDAWAMILRRDRAGDGRFVYAVRTTGIYCRPSCPSRRPLRENVSFHATPDAAELAGFRACRRCRPRSLAGTGTERAIRRAIEYIEAHLDDALTLERLGREVGVSPWHLQRTFRERVGVSPRSYQAAKKLERLKGRLAGGETVSRATFEAGYGSVRGAYEAAAAAGVTPGAYRRGGAGLRIRYTTVSSPLGRLLVGATERGVCAVALADDDAALETALRSDFPEAAIARDDDALREWAGSVVGWLEGAHPGLALPLELHGTAFQLRVWEALRGIPPGETRSYGEVARAIGRPRAVRAVARACATNHAALVVPCHRVVPSTGGAGGYRWGPERKRRLLEQERRMAGD